MCGSFERYLDGYLYTGQLGQIDFKFSKTGECKPSQQIDVLLSHNCNSVNPKERLSASLYSWGLKTPWSPKLLINARLETVSDKSTFAQAFELRRCLIVLSAWHEWRDEGGPKKQPYRFAYEHRQALVMAGVYYPSSELNPSGAVVSLTCEPSRRFSEFHHRMPLLLRDPDAYLFGAFDAQRAVRELHMGDDRMTIDKL